MMRPALLFGLLAIAGCARSPDAGNVVANSAPAALAGTNRNAPENLAAAQPNVAANALANAAAAPAVGAPQMGSCNGGECSWSRTQSSAVVRREASGILYRLSLLGGTAPEGEDAAVRWNRQPHEVFIFCSPLLPTVILPDEGHLQVDVLDFVAGPTPVLETSAELYVHTCHPGEDMAAEGFAARHGYRAQDAEREITLSRPEDIFGYAR
jgi:hypothetical protein